MTSEEINGLLPYLAALRTRDPEVLKQLGITDGFFMRLGVKKGLFGSLAKTPLILAKDLVQSGSYEGDTEVKPYNVNGQQIEGVALSYGKKTTALIQQQSRGDYNLRLTHYRRFGDKDEEAGEERNNRLVEIAQSTIILSRRAYGKWSFEIPNSNSSINDGRPLEYDPNSK